MSRLSKYVKEKIVKVLVAALVVGSVAGNEGITAQAAANTVDTFETAVLDDPYAFILYANEYKNPTHIESNIAVGAMDGTVNPIYGGKSYIGDFTFTTDSGFVTGHRTSMVVLARMNSDGTRNSIEEIQGQLYHIKYDEAGEKVYEMKTEPYLSKDGSEITDADIKGTIAAKIESMKKEAASLYNRTSDENTLVLNISDSEIANNIATIIKTADAGKKVIVNVTGNGSVNTPNINIDPNWGLHDTDDKYADWAANIIWNFGDATTVNITNQIYGYVLAPNATVYNVNDVIGGVICNVFIQNGEVHRANPWKDRPTPEPEVTPSPAPSTEPSVSPSPETPGTETPGTETPGTETPGTETPGTETPGTETPGTETPGTETPGTETPGTETPGTETPGTETPGTETPGTETPGTETPGTETPGTETPGTETPGTETPGTETPGTETPGTETPGTETPGTETPGTETPGTTTPDSTPTPDEPGTPTDPGTPDDPTDPGTPTDPVTPEVLGARRRRVVTIEDDPTPLADRAVLGASRRPQTGDDSDAWNLGFALSLTGLGAWLILKKKQ